VAAFQEMFKKRLHISVPMIIHGFSKNEQTAKQLLDNGFHFFWEIPIEKSRTQTFLKRP
jgi:Tat protein secretion system quality control protein TatD with DNase activity